MNDLNDLKYFKNLSDVQNEQIRQFIIQHEKTQSALLEERQRVEKLERIIELQKSEYNNLLEPHFVEKLKAEIDRLNNYVISGHQIIENEMKAEIERLKQIVTEPGEGNRYRLLMNDNDKLKAENEELKNTPHPGLTFYKNKSMHQYELITKLTRQLDKSIKLLNKIKELTAPYSNVMPSSMIYAFCFKALQEAEGME